MALHRAKASAALEIVLNHSGQIKAAVGRHCAPERYDRNRDRIGHTLRDVDLQLGSGRYRCQPQGGQDCAAR
jgi:hypothetical protein